MRTPWPPLQLVALLATVALGGAPSPTGAQTGGTDPLIERGFSADRSYQVGGLDSVDLATGTVSLAIPIGPRYPVGGVLSYGLTLAYDSSIWDFEEATDDYGHPITKAHLTRHSNAGQGWRLSLGELYDPADDHNPQPWHWVFVAPDASQHSFKPTLHHDEPVDPSTWYTRDSAYLRLRFCGPASTLRCVDMPNGLVYTFAPGSPDTWRLDRIEDPFGNWVAVAYDDVAHTETISDSEGRSHRVEYTAFTVDGETRYFVDRVSLMTFGDTPPSRSAVYELDYTVHPFLPRSGRDNSDLTPLTVQAALLSSVHLPEVPGNEPTDAGRYTFGYCLTLGGPGFEGVQDSPGMLKSLRHPTGGAVEWTYQSWSYTAAIDDPSSPDPLDMLTISMEWAGVKSKTLWDRAHLAAGAVDLGTWQYSSWLVRPGPTYGGVPEERITIVTSPEGDDTAYYFRAMPDDIGGLQDHLTEAWSYGLPFTTRDVDPVADGQTLYLSVEHYDGGTTVDTVNAPTVIHGTKVRSEYVRYHHDAFDAPLTDESYRNVNRYRQAAMTVYHDDLVDSGGSHVPEDLVERWKASSSSDFDGLGHYRTTTTAGSFAGENVRTTTTTYNPAAGSYPGSFVVPASSARWILDTYDARQQTGGGATARQDFCFNPLGALTRSRVVAPSFTGPSSRSARDLVVVYDHDSDGNLVTERHYGGDVQTVGTSADLCTMSLPALPYAKAAHTWSAGVLATTRHYDWVEDDLGNVSLQPLPYLSVERQVDPATGLVRREYDTAGIATDFEYDARLRPTWVRPQTGLAEGNDAWVEYQHVPFTADGVGPELEVYLRPNGSTTGVLARQGFEYDPLGRLVHERRLLPSGAWTGRTTTYNGQSWVVAVSEWGTTSHATTFTAFDPFGRPGQTTLADGSVVAPSYTGESEVEETVQVFTDSGGILQQRPVTVSQSFDRFGRPRLTTEYQAGGAAAALTQYGYDAGSRLETVTVSVAGGLSQTRTFSYDNRGFLLSEQHPEAGAGGNGLVLYSEYDPLGNAGRRVEGDVDLRTRYDHAGRLLGVDAMTSCGIEVPLTGYSYGSQNAPGDRALGKLTTATTFNYFDGVEPYCTGARTPDHIFSDGFEDGTTNAWSATFSTEESLMVRQRWVYGGRGGRVSSLETTVGSDVVTQTYAWDGLGAPAVVGYPDLAGYSEPPQALGSVATTSTNGFLTAVGGFAPTLAYHPNGALQRVAHSNGVEDVLWMDGSYLQRPARIRARLGGVVRWDTGAYGYDGAGNVIAAGSNAYVYDHRNRLTRSDALAGTVSQSYGYDGFGNLVSVTDALGTRSFPADLATNRLAAASYDSRGNLTSWGGFSHQWRPTGEMRARTGPGVDSWYAYDAGGQRVLTHDRLAGSRTLTLRDLAGNVLRVFEKPAGGAWTWRKDYVYRNGLLLASKDAAGTVHFTLDHLGTPRYLTDDLGNPVAQHEYFGFGEEATSTWRDEAMKFTGHERDLEGTPDRLDDLDYMRARYYNPLLGRFLSIDPIGGRVGASQGYNCYAYVGNSPLNYVDPFGLMRRVADQDGKITFEDEVLVVAEDPEPKVSEVRRTMLRVAGGRATTEEVPWNPEPAFELSYSTPSARLPFIGVPVVGDVTASITPSEMTADFSIAPGYSPSGQVSALLTAETTFGTPSNGPSASVDLRGGSGQLGGGVAVSTDFANYTSVKGMVGFGAGGRLKVNQGQTIPLFSIRREW